MAKRHKLDWNQHENAKRVTTPVRSDFLLSVINEDVPDEK